MSIDRQAARRAFNAYVRNYDYKDEKIRLKIEHTYKVCGLCEKIAAAEGFSAEDIDIAWLIGLLHDIGRFEQLRRYDTFIDSESVDHAELGSEILFKEGKIREFTDDASLDALIKSAVETHSLYRLPENISDREKIFGNIIRDADKVDIFRVNVAFSPEEIYNTEAAVLRNEKITPEVMRCFFEEHAVLRSLKRNTVDHVVSQIALVFELVYPSSLGITVEQGYLKRLIGFKSENPETRGQLEKISELVNAYIERRLREVGAGGGE